MKPVTLTISNEPESLAVVQSAVNTFVLAAGAESSVARQMELVAEELLSNVIRFDYAPGQQEQITLHLAGEPGQLVLTIRFKGIPFDVEFLRRCEQVNLADIVGGEARGLGLYLVKHFCDELQYRNRGRQGQEIVVRRRLSGEPLPAPSGKRCEPGEPSPKPLKTVIRRMLPPEAAAVSKLAYCTYNYSYPYEHIYDPEQVRRLNETNQVISYLVVDRDNGEIIGHGALIPDAASGLDEVGWAFVLPAYRGQGCLNELGKRLIEAAGERGSAGVFSIAVASHPFSQRTAVKFGLRETALLVSRGEPFFMAAIPDRKVVRETVVNMVRLFGDARRGVYYPPPRHRGMLVEICDNLGLAAAFADCSGPIDLPEQGALKQDVDAHQAGHIFLLAYGRDTLPQVRRILRGWCLDRLETIYIYLPLKQPGTSCLTASFEELGFFFGGLQLGGTEGDQLVLQYLNNQRYDYSTLKPATSFGQKLIDYVRGCDPDAAYSSTPPPAA